MQYLLGKLNVLKEYKKTLDFLCGFTIIGSKTRQHNKNRHGLLYNICITKLIRQI